MSRKYYILEFADILTNTQSPPTKNPKQNARNITASLLSQKVYTLTRSVSQLLESGTP